MQYYKSDYDGVLEILKSHKKGLSNNEVTKRQEKYGQNKLKEKKRISPWQIFLAQFKSALILILLAATVVSAVIGEIIDAVVILIIVVLNAVFGFVQEYKAEKAIESLKNMMNPKSKVLRNGKKIQIDSSELTIGDVLLIEEWDKIAADGRLLQAINLEILEASLTGESLPVKKHTDAIAKEAVLWDQKNMIFSGTSVTRGRGMAVVTSIWMNTEIGKIAEMIQNTPDKQTNLQKKLAKLSKRLGVIILVICTILFGAYYFVNHEPIVVAFLTAVALAVAAIPEWLPAVVTISLALGVKRMVKKNALMRRLSSVETLWSVDVICTDKTGTLTKNEMTVTKLFVDNESWEISGTGYEAEWIIKNEGWKILEDIDGWVNKLLEIWVLCNQSALEDGKVIWDPTEWCLLVSALKANIHKETLLKKYERKDEIPFDSTRKMMSSIYTKDKETYVFSKGAPEIILEKCDSILINGELQKLDAKTKENILKQNESFAKDALRVLGFAYKKMNNGLWKINNENCMIFVGLQAMIDPPREEVKDAIKVCKNAGIRVIMITGDNLLTAQAIAHELGIQWAAIQGVELDNDINIKKILKKTNIFARVNPEHKQKIIAALKEMGHVTSMTWDWVNDAPALKNADIGVAMGITGTDVSKEASDMILLDDNFTTIVSAVEEWRWIFDNIKKFVFFAFNKFWWNLGDFYD